MTYSPAHVWGPGDRIGTSTGGYGVILKVYLPGARALARGLPSEPRAEVRLDNWMVHNAPLTSLTIVEPFKERSMTVYTYAGTDRVVEREDPVMTPSGDLGSIRQMFMVMDETSQVWASVWMRDGTNQDWPLNDLTYCPPEVASYEELVDRPSRESELMDQVEKLKLILELEREKHEEDREDTVLRAEALTMALGVTPEREGESGQEHGIRIIEKADVLLDFLVGLEPVEQQKAAYGQPGKEEDDGVLAVLVWDNQGLAHIDRNETESADSKVKADKEGA